MERQCSIVPGTIIIVTNCKMEDSSNTEDHVRIFPSVCSQVWKSYLIDYNATVHRLITHYSIGLFR